MVISIFPSVEGIQNQNTLNGSAKIGLSENVKPLEVNAAPKYIKTKKVKKIKKSSKYKKAKAAPKTYTKPKKVKAAYKYNYNYKKVKTNNAVQSSQKAASKIKASGKCSCSLYADYNVHTGKWLNYCPYCHKYGTLVYDKPSDCPEGMIRCIHCDADFCIVHGKAHTYSNSKYLTKA